MGRFPADRLPRGTVDYWFFEGSRPITQPLVGNGSFERTV